MCKTLYGIAFAAGLATSYFFAISPTAADPYKWCALYSGNADSRNCGFITIEQCRATVSGIGGFCEPNQFYTGPDVTPVNGTRKHQN
jgi:hypothetical protein